MAHYIPDYKLEKATKLVDSLTDENERDELIKYYIKKHKEYHDKDKRRLKEYQEVFDKMGKFLPNGRQTVFGG